MTKAGIDILPTDGNKGAKLIFDFVGSLALSFLNGNILAPIKNLGSCLSYAANCSLKEYKGASFKVISNMNNIKK